MQLVLLLLGLWLSFMVKIVLLVLIVVLSLLVEREMFCKISCLAVMKQIPRCIQGSWDNLWLQKSAWDDDEKPVQKGEGIISISGFKTNGETGSLQELVTIKLWFCTLGSKGWIFELVDWQMRWERGVFNYILTYNTVTSCLCEVGRIEEATSPLEDMLWIQLPSINLFKLFIEACCKVGKFMLTQ